MCGWGNHADHCWTGYRYCHERSLLFSDSYVSETAYCAGKLMKRFLPIPILIAIIALQLFLCSLVPKHHTWTLLHANAANTACSGSGTTCTITVASTTSGNQLVAVAWTPTSTTGKNLSAAGSGGTWVFPANCAA